MTERELSQKLEEIAGRIEEVIGWDGTLFASQEALFEISKELRCLSNQKYTAGSLSWDDLKTNAKPTKKKFPF